MRIWIAVVVVEKCYFEVYNWYVIIGTRQKKTFIQNKTKKKRRKLIIHIYKYIYKQKKLFFICFWITWNQLVDLVNQNFVDFADFAVEDVDGDEEEEEEVVAVAVVVECCY